MNPFAALAEPVKVRGTTQQMTVHQLSRASNPWGLTRAELATVSLYAETGMLVEVAKELSVSTQTIHDRINKAVKTMGVKNKTLAAIAYDRWMRDQE